MSQSTRFNIRARSPSDANNISIGRPKERAGGLPAVLSSLKHGFKKAGVIKATKSLLKVNQKSGFDCPGCAWPDPEERSAFEFCENGAKALAEETTSKRVTSEFFQKYSVSELSHQSDQWLGKLGRLTSPMYLPKGASNYQPVTWDKSFKLIARKLEDLSSPDQAIFYTSGRTSNEAAFVYQLMVRMYGTNNFPDCSNMCHESSGVGLYEAIGSGKGSVTLHDFNHADAIFVIGQNPGTNHPRMLTALQKAARRGCTIVTINPIKEAGNTGFSHPQEITGILGVTTQISNLHIPVRINGDVALLKGIMKMALEQDRGVDKDFIKKYTSGYDEFLGDIKNTSWLSIVKNSGVTKDDISKVAEVFISAKKLICCWAMGLTQHQNAVGNVQSVVNLLLLGGHFGRLGAGACPVRGHSNVQGDRSMGITERPRSKFLKNLGQEFGFFPPTKHGLDTIGAIKAMHEGRAKLFFSMGGNFLSATPDTDFTAEALEKCELTVQVSTKLNRSHLVTGQEALILPCLGRTEIDIQGGKAQFVTVENSMGVVHTSEGHLRPSSDNLNSEVKIVCELAKQLLPNKTKLFEEMSIDYSKIRDHISQVVPGFENMNEKLKLTKQFVLYHPVRDELIFNTPSRRAQFTIHQITPKIVPPKHFLMMTIRSHDQYNTTIYGENDRYRGIYGGRYIVLMNKADILSHNLKPKDVVDLVSVFNDCERRVEKFLVVPYDIPEGCLATYFPEANPLVPIDDYAVKSHTPSSKSVVVRIEKRSYD